MSRLCIVVSDLNPAAVPAWDFAAAGARAGQEAVLLHAAEIGEAFAQALREHARSLGVEYRSVVEVAPVPDLPVFPPVEAHRTGLGIARALAALNPSAVWFLGSPAVAAASLEARLTGLALADSAMGLWIGSLVERSWEASPLFAAGGRADLATAFLERRAAEHADAVIAGSNEIREWLGRSGWTVPQMLAQPPASEPPPTLPPPPPPPPRSNLRVSVCIPYFEQADFLCPALEMLAAQTRLPDEIVVIDDGSQSPEAAAAWEEAQRRFRRPNWVFLRQSNAGPSAARNRAAREASGDLVIFCDADNRFPPHMVAAFAEALERSGADCVTSGFRAFRDPPGDGELGSGYYFFPIGPCLELALVENDLGDTNFCVRRDAFLSLRGFPTDNTAASEDWEFLIRLVLAGRRLVVRPEALFEYRIAAGSHARRHAELESARMAVRPLLEGAPLFWRRLWPHFAGLVRSPEAERAAAELGPARHEAARLGAEVGTLGRRLSALAAEAERLRGDAAAARAEAERSRLERDEQRGEARRLRAANRVRRAENVLLQHAAQTHEAESDEARREAEQLRRDLAAAAEAATRERLRLEGELTRARDKVRRMQASLSWKLTAPLRWIRRRWFDRRRPAPPAPAPAAPPRLLDIASHIDSPRVWRPQERELTVRGWCFARDAVRLEAVRARISERTYDGAYGLARPDLPRIFAEWPQSGESGFKIDLIILGSDRLVVLEARDERGEWHPFFERALGPAQGEAPHGSYEHWVRAHDALEPAELERLRRAAEAMPPMKLSVLMPVFNPPPRWLERAIGSVRAQVYPHWELCIADDASTDPAVGAVLERAAAADPRITLVRRERNGHISEATNTALESATGEYCALFDHDDELAPHALYCIAAEIAAHPDADLIYTDEDKIDEQGFRFDPHFKPDWNPDLLRSQNYLSHLAVYRTSLLRGLGGLRAGYEGSQDWDLALRATETLEPGRIRHVPRVLYHWRAAEGSTALHLAEKGYAGDAARKALAGHFERIGVPAELSRTVGGHWRASYPLPPERPLVSILIPTRNAVTLTRLCIASVIARTRYAPYEIILVDNRSDDPDALAYFREAEEQDEVRVLKHDAPFNYSAINNFAAREAKGEVLCLLNNDMEVVEPKWLDEMVGHLLRPGVGVVGARLYYPDFRIQHAGVITGLGGVAGHAFKRFERTEAGTPQFRPHLTQNLSAVTAACLVVRRAVYFEAGGFDEGDLAVAFNDVDFCLKVERLGLRNVYVPAAELIHHESASRGAEDTPEKVRRFQGEIEAIRRRWGERLLQDPAYNPNLTLDTEDFGFAYPPRLPPLVAPAS